MTTESLTQSQLARKIACIAHAGQFRRDGVTPHISHVEAVVMRLVSDWESDETIAVGYAHDVLEDSNETPELLLAAGLSQNVVTAIEVLTKQNGEPYHEYIDRVKRNPIAKKVKIADILQNLGDDPTEHQIVKYSHALLKLVDH